MALVRLFPSPSTLLVRNAVVVVVVVHGYWRPNVLSEPVAPSPRPGQQRRHCWDGEQGWGQFDNGQVRIEVPHFAARFTLDDFLGRSDRAQRDANVYGTIFLDIVHLATPVLVGSGTAPIQARGRPIDGDDLRQRRLVVGHPNDNHGFVTVRYRLCVPPINFCLCLAPPRWNSGTSYPYFALQKYAPTGKECVSSIFASVVGGLFECVHGIQIVRLEQGSQPQFTRHHPIVIGFVVCLIIPGNQLDGTIPLCDQQDRLVRIQAVFAGVDCPCCSECCPTWEGIPQAVHVET
jgi:hypothetical protein